MPSILRSGAVGTKIRPPTLIVGMSPEAAASYPRFRRDSERLSRRENVHGHSLCSLPSPAARASMSGCSHIICY